MLDLIEYLAQWVRGAADAALPRARRAARAPRRAGAAAGATRPRSCSSRSRVERDARAGRRRCCRDGERTPTPSPRSPSAPGGNPFFAEEMARRLAEEAGGEPVELPDTVQALLAARLDSLEPVERRLVAARRGRRPHVLGGRARAGRAERGRRAAAARCGAPGEGHHRPRRPACALAGEREFAFKHVLIRDVAYGMLPQGRARHKHFEVGSFIEERAGERTDEVVALLAEHYGRAAHARRARPASTGRARADPRQGAALPRGRRRRRGAPLLEPGGVRPLRGRARASCRHDAGRAARGCWRSRATSRCAWAASTRRSSVWEECLEYHRQPGGPRARRRPAPQDRRRAVAQGRAQAGDRALPEGHQPAQGRAAVARARAPLRGGRLAVHARRATTCSRSTPRRRRCGSPSSWGRRAPQAARTGSSAACSAASATPPRRARTSSARSSWRATPTPRETILALLTLGHHLESLRGRLRRRGQPPTARRSRSPQQVGDVPAAGRAARRDRPSSRSTRADWDAGRALQPTPAPSSPSARAWSASSAFPTCCAGACTGASGDWDGVRGLLPARARAGRAGRLVGGLLRRALLAGAHAARPRRPAGARDATLDRALDVCERAGLIAQSIQAISARALLHRLAGATRRRARRPTPAVEIAERCTTPWARRRRSKRRGAVGSLPEARSRTSSARATAGRASAGRLMPRAASCCSDSGCSSSDRAAGTASLQRAAAEYDELGVHHLVARARSAAEQLAQPRT